MIRIESLTVLSNTLFLVFSFFIFFFAHLDTSRGRKRQGLRGYRARKIPDARARVRFLDPRSFHALKRDRRFQSWPVGLPDPGGCFLQDGNAAWASAGYLDLQGTRPDNDLLSAPAVRVEPRLGLGTPLQGNPPISTRVRHLTKHGQIRLQ